MGYQDTFSFKRGRGSQALPIVAGNNGVDARVEIAQREMLENGSAHSPADHQAAVQYCISNDLV